MYSVIYAWVWLREAAESNKHHCLLPISPIIFVYSSENPALLLIDYTLGIIFNYN